MTAGPHFPDLSRHLDAERPVGLRAGRAALALVVVVTVATACGEPDEGRPVVRTDSTTANLLASARDAGDGDERGMSRLPAPGQEYSPPPSRDIDIDVLGFNYGSDDAPVRVVELSDYGCGYCRRFHQETWPSLRDEFVATGKVQWKFLPFVTGMFGNSPVAAEGAECVLAQGVEPFERMNEGLWEDQSAWKSGDDPSGVVRRLALESGADMVAWQTCMDQDRRNDRVAAATGLARRLGVRGTPTFYVVGYPPLQGALPVETFRKVLDLVYEDVVERTGG